MPACWEVFKQPTAGPVRDTTLLKSLLSFPRLSVVSTKFDDVTTDLILGVEVRGRPRCPTCEKKRPIYDTRPGRRWRHLDVLGRRCWLEGPVRRVNCRKCDSISTELLPWATADSTFTIPFEDMVGWMVQRLDKTSVSLFMRISWVTVGSIVERAANRYRQPFDPKQLRAIGVDELSYRKGHRYITLVTDHESARVIWWKEGRSAETLTAFFQEIGPEACAAIEWVTIDMSAAYRKAIVQNLPNAVLIYDRFHAQKLMNEALDETRREEWRKSQGTLEGDEIKGLRWAILKNPWNLTRTQSEALAGLQDKNRSIFRGYLIKETFGDIYQQLHEPAKAMELVKEWLGWASRSKLAPFVKVARTIREHLEGVVAYFRTGYTNGRVEGFNTKARLATRRAYGFHSAAAVMAMIELCCSGIVIPLPHQ